MAQFTRQIKIDAPAERAWEALADFGAVHKYNPLVAHSHSTSAQSGGVGATRHCGLTLNGASVEERIVEWTEGESYVVDIYDGSKAPPFRQARAHLSVRPDGAGSIVTGTLEYTLKFGPVGVLMDRLMVAPQLDKAWSQLLAGLKHYVETGQEVGDGTPLDVQAVLVGA